MDVSMSNSVQPAVEGLEEAFREGTARFEEVTPEGTLTSGQETTKRCQHCGEPVHLDTDHAWASVIHDGATGDEATCYPVFCDPTCLHEWSVEVDESPHEGDLTTSPR